MTTETRTGETRTGRTRTAKARGPRPPQRPLTAVIMAPDGRGGWHEASELELILGQIACDWAAAGQVAPPALLQRVTREYERGLWAPEDGIDLAA